MGKTEKETTENNFIAEYMLNKGSIRVFISKKFTRRFLNQSFYAVQQFWLMCVSAFQYQSDTEGGFPVMAKITRILAANICGQFFFVTSTAVSTRCLVENFQLICYSQRVNATSQCNDSGSSRCSKWPNNRMVAVVKHCWLLAQGRRGCRER